MRIGLIFGGRSVEHEVSVTSARTVARGLVAAGHTVVPLPIGADGVWADPALGTAGVTTTSCGSMRSSVDRSRWSRLISVRRASPY
jgi:D-alanine-D-alanine ligase